MALSLMTDTRLGASSDSSLSRLPSVATARYHSRLAVKILASKIPTSNISH